MKRSLNSFPFLLYGIIYFLYLTGVKRYRDDSHVLIISAYLLALCVSPPPPPSNLLPKVGFHMFPVSLSWRGCQWVKTAKKWANKRGIQGLSQRMGKNVAHVPLLSPPVSGKTVLLYHRTPTEPEHGLRILASVAFWPFPPSIRASKLKPILFS